MSARSLCRNAVRCLPGVDKRPSRYLLAVDQVTQRLELQGTLGAYWNDYRLAFDPSCAGTNEMRFPFAVAAQLWTPLPFVTNEVARSGRTSKARRVDAATTTPRAVHRSRVASTPRRPRRGFFGDIKSASRRRRGGPPAQVTAGLQSDFQQSLLVASDGSVSLSTRRRLRTKCKMDFHKSSPRVVNNDASRLDAAVTTLMVRALPRALLCPTDDPRRDSCPCRIRGPPRRLPYDTQHCSVDFELNQPQSEVVLVAKAGFESNSPSGNSKWKLRALTEQLASDKELKLTFELRRKYKYYETYVIIPAIILAILPA